jgi:hypothetical protein
MESVTNSESPIPGSLFRKLVPACVLKETNRRFIFTVIISLTR